MKTPLFSNKTNSSVKKVLYFFAVVFAFMATMKTAYSQNGVLIATGTGNADNSAMLEVQSNSKGLLIPRMTSGQRTGISLPATGLLVYQTTSPGTGFWYYDGSAWWQLSTSSGIGSWSLTGNAGTFDGTNFIGTTDNVPLNFRVNNQQAGRLDYSLGNAFFGYQAGNANTTGANNSAIGYDALYSNVTGVANSAIGIDALYYNTGGHYNTAVGNTTLLYNTTGYNNTACGNWSLFSNSTGYNNTAIGTNADVGSGNLNNATAIGANATVSRSNSLVLGNNVNVGIGTSSPTATLTLGNVNQNGTYGLADWDWYSFGYNQPKTQITYYRVGNIAQSNDGSFPFILSVCMQGSTTYGQEMGVLQTGHPGSGGDNLGILGLQPNSGTVEIGSLVPHTDYTLYVAGTEYCSSNSIISGNVGIGIASPATKLEVDGTSGNTLKIVDGNQGTGKILTSDANGVASWTTPATGLTGSGTATQVAFWNGSSVLSGNSNLYWDNTNSRLGVYNSSPTATLTVGSVAQNGTFGATDWDWYSFGLGQLKTQTTYYRVGNLLQTSESSFPFTLGVNFQGNGTSGNEVGILQTGHPGGGGDNNGMLSLQPLGTSSVLIGTTTPETTYKLYVAGSTYVGGDVVLTGALNANSSIGTANKVLHGGSPATYSGVAIADLTATGTPGSTTYLCGNGTWATPTSSGITGSGTATQVAFWSTTNSAISGNSNLYWDNTNSRLGIGTAGPTQTLTVSGSTNAYGYTAQIINPSTSTSGDQLNITTAAGTWGLIEGIDPSSTSASAYHGPNYGYLINYQNAPLIFGTNNTAYMTINGSGNVGVGGSPSYKLDVSGDINLTGALRISGGAGTSGQVLTSNGSTASWVTPSSSGITGSGTSGYDVKWTGSSTVGTGAIYENASYASIAGTSLAADFTVGGINANGVNGHGNTDWDWFAFGCNQLKTTNTYYRVGALLQSSDASNPFILGVDQYGNGTSGNEVAVLQTGHIGLDNTGMLGLQTEAGTVLIGTKTANTSYKLYVNGSTYFSSTVNIAGGALQINGSVGGSGQVLTSNGTTASWATPSSSGVTGSGSATQVAYWSGSSAISGNSNLYWDNSNTRLGIGTSSPAQTLTVSGSTNTYGYTAQFVNPSTSTSGDQLNITTSLGSWGLIEGIDPSSTSASAYHGPNYAYLVNYQNAPLIFGTNNTAYMTMNGSGNVGIGVSPSYKLDVSGDINLTGALRISGSAGTSGYVLTSNGSTASWQASASGVGGSGAATRLAFWTAASTLASSTNLNWNNTNSFLGIMTASPLSYLTIGTVPQNGATIGNTDWCWYQFGYNQSRTDATYRRVGALLQSNDASAPFFLGVNALGNATQGNEIAILQTGHPGVSNDGYLGLQTEGGYVLIGGRAVLSTSYKLYVTGQCYTTGTWQGSDMRFKKNIIPLQNSLQKVIALQGVNYDWNLKDYPDRGFESGKQIGFIAQEVEKVIPEVVKTDDKGYKALSYDKLTAVLAEAIKEQQKQIDDLKAQNSALLKDNANIKADNATLKVSVERINQKLGLDDKAEK